MLIISCAKVSIFWCKVIQSLVHKLDVETGSVYFPIGSLRILFSSSRGDFFIFTPISIHSLQQLIKQMIQKLSNDNYTSTIRTPSSPAGSSCTIFPSLNKQAPPLAILSLFLSRQCELTYKISLPHF